MAVVTCYHRSVALFCCVDEYAYYLCTDCFHVVSTPAGWMHHAFATMTTKITSHYLYLTCLQLCDFHRFGAGNHGS